MQAETRSPRLAVLIDAENASPRIADGLFEEVAKIGEASVRRIYGDFSGQQLKGWADILAKHAIVPQQQFAHIAGKNAADIALVIDAMDLLYSGRLDGFCLVSSDSDFTRLAARIREQGIDVYGVGEQKTPESFRQACRRFIYTENFLVVPTSEQGQPVPPPLKPVSSILPVMRKILKQAETEDGWLPLSQLGNQLTNLVPDFDPRSFGASKLSDLIRKAGAFELEQVKGGTLRVRAIAKATDGKAQRPPSTT